MSMPAAPAMRWASVLLQAPDAETAAAGAPRALREALEPGPVDLVLAFFGAPLAPHADRLRVALRAEFPQACLAGVSGHGVIGTTEERETGPSLVLLGARLPNVEVRPFLLPPEEWSSPPADPETFAQLAPGAEGAETLFLFTDPASLAPDPVLAALARFAPGLRVSGGVASAGRRAGENVLFLNDWTAREGGIALALAGDVRVDTFVSQGCRPAGPPLAITAAERNIVYELDGKPAAERLHEILGGLGERDRELAKRGLFLGRPLSPGALGAADYVVRNFIGHDPESGAVALADEPRQGERVRLFLRDAHAAYEDLSLLLSPQSFDARAQAVLLFACTGRGQSFHGRPNGDLDVVQQALGGVPAAGLFVNGEIGPLGDRNRLHSYAVSVAIVRPR